MNTQTFPHETEAVVWDKIKNLVRSLAQKSDLITERNFYGDFDDAKEESKIWKKMSNKVLRLLIIYKNIKGPKHLFNKNELLHNGFLIHPSYKNIFNFHI